MLWARVRVYFGFDRVLFLATSPREIDMLFDVESDRRRERWLHTAQISLLQARGTLHREDGRQFELDDFMPPDLSGRPVDQGDQDMRDFIDSLNRGETIEQSPEQIKQFRNMFQQHYLDEIEGAGKTTPIGPSGKREPVKSAGH